MRNFFWRIHELGGVYLATLIIVTCFNSKLYIYIIKFQIVIIFIPFYLSCKIFYGWYGRVPLSQISGNLWSKNIFIKKYTYRKIYTSSYFYIINKSYFYLVIKNILYAYNHLSIVWNLKYYIFNLLNLLFITGNYFYYY